MVARCSADIAKLLITTGFSMLPTVIGVVNLYTTCMVSSPTTSAGVGLNSKYMDAARIQVYTDNKMPLPGVLAPHAESTAEWSVAIKKHSGKSTATLTHKDTYVIAFAASNSILC